MVACRRYNLQYIIAFGRQKIRWEAIIKQILGEELVRMELA
jgi:hypothetical protein